MSEQTAFLQRAETKANDPTHLAKILNAVGSFYTASDQTKSRQFADWQHARQQAAKIKNYTLQHLPDLLEEFETKATSNGAKVLWAENASEARQHFLDIIERHAAKKIVKSKSMVTEEIELNEMLKHKGIEVLESDLGELIVQLANEKPYHIIAPAIHKTKEEIAALFHEKLDAPVTDSPEELTMVARRHLRETYLTADIGVTGANFLIADQGAIVMTENEGNGRLTMACPPLHIAICGIEKVLPRMSDLAQFLPLLATSATGQRISSYNSIVRGPRQKGEADGPDEMYIILLDNGRTNLYANETFRQSLRCIRCGACFYTCPVWRTIGGHAYNTPYQGPIGSVIMPQLQGQKKWQHLSYASSLCGSCSDVCPVNIDLHHLLLENRREALEKQTTGKMWPLAMKLWAHVMTNRNRLQRYRRIGKLTEKILWLGLPSTKRNRIPKMAKKSFAELWSDDEQP